MSIKLNLEIWKFEKKRGLDNLEISNNSQVAYCDLSVREMGNINNWTVQCVLMVNIIILLSNVLSDDPSFRIVNALSEFLRSAVCAHGNCLSMIYPWLVQFSILK